MKSIILTLSANGSLGDQNSTNWTCQEDKKWFRDVTNHAKTLVIGRKTFESIGSKPLKGRVNYLITSSPEKYEKTDELIPVTIEQFESLNLKDYCVIGGYQIYKYFWDKVDILYISRHKTAQTTGEKFIADTSNFKLLDQTDSAELTKQAWIKLPYTPLDIEITYDDNDYLNKAREVMNTDSLDWNWPDGCIFVKDGVVVSTGANGSDFHQQRDKEMKSKDPDYKFGGCIRREMGIPTGQGYDLCEGCSEKNHAEAKGIRKLIDTTDYAKLSDSVCYLYGHWWCCQSCCNYMQNAGVKKVVLSKEFTKNLFKIII